MGSYYGDRAAASTVMIMFATTVNGVPTTLAGTPAVSVYKNSTTESTAGITLAVDYDGRTGLNQLLIDTSADGTFYATNNDFTAVITTGTVGGVSQVGVEVGAFSIGRSSASAPTVAQIATAVWQDATAGDFTTAGSIGKDMKTGAVPGAANGLFIAGTNAATSITTGLTANIIGNITGALSGAVGSVTGAVGSVTAGVTLAASAVQAIWDALTSALTTVGSIGKLLVTNIDAAISSRLASASYTAPTNLTAAQIATGVWQDATAGDFTAASSIGKDLKTGAVPGAANGLFIAGTNAATAITTALTANVIGNVTGNLSGSVGSVTGAVGSVTGLTASDVGAIKAKTDNLPSDPADASDIAGAFATVNSTLATIASYVDTEVAAIKAKTDQLTFSTTNRVDAQVFGMEAGTVTAAAIAADAITDAKVASDVTIASVTGAVGSVTGAVGSVTGLTASDVGAIKTQTDKFVFTVANKVDANTIVIEGSDATNQIRDSILSDATRFAGANIDTTISSRTKPADTQARVTLVDTLTTYTGDTPQTGDSYALANGANGFVALKGDTAAINAKTTNLPSDPADESLIIAATDAIASAISGLNNLSAAQVNAEVDTALADYDGPTHAELTAELATADDATLAAITGLNNLSQANIRTAIGLASANLDTQIDALPTNAELATALAGADDATLSAIAALNNLSQANVRSAVGLASGNLDTQLSGINAKTTNLPSDPADESVIIAATDALAALITAVKAKTDPLTFSVSGQLDANVQYVNDTMVTGNGSPATPWGP